MFVANKAVSQEDKELNENIKLFVPNEEEKEMRKN